MDPERARSTQGPLGSTFMCLCGKHTEFSARSYELGGISGKVVGGAAVGVVVLEAHAAEGLADAGLAVLVRLELGKFAVEGGGNVGDKDALRRLVRGGLLVDVHEHLVDVETVAEGRVSLLDLAALVVGEPIAGAVANLVEGLGVELLVVDGRIVVDVGAIGNADADEASAAGTVGQRVLAVGVGHE